MVPASASSNFPSLSSTLPLVLDSPHSGEDYPVDFDHAPPRVDVRRAEDTHVARLYRSAPRHGATLIEATFPRSYIDPNRSLADVDPELLADAWGEPLAPSLIADKLAARFRLLGTQGLVGMALGGIDMALWDALARVHGVPLARLFGAAAKPIPAYGAVGHDGPSGSARTAVARGGRARSRSRTRPARHWTRV
jgi:N-formylglutamate deformylase